MTVPVLETLYATRARLTGGKRFDFMDYRRCTCGHIFAAAEGHGARGALDVPMARDGAYADVIVGVAQALGYKGHRAEWATSYVSNVTSRASAARGPLDAGVTREDAIAVIDQAIAAIEAGQERNRLDVLAQTKAIVDAAAPEPVAV